MMRNGARSRDFLFSSLRICTINLRDVASQSN